MRQRLEYAVSVWSPHLQKDIDMLEKTQKFATYYVLSCGIGATVNSWRNYTFQLLLNAGCISTSVFNVQNYSRAHVFPSDIVTPSTTVTHNPRSLLLQEPFAQTNAYENSFLPQSTPNWNSLPNYVVLSPSLVLLSIVYRCTRCS